MRCRTLRAAGFILRLVKNGAFCGYFQVSHPREEASTKPAARGKLGARGIEQILEIKLTPDEQNAVQESADSVKELVGVIGC